MSTEEARSKGYGRGLEGKASAISIVDALNPFMGSKEVKAQEEGYSAGERDRIFLEKQRDMLKP